MSKPSRSKRKELDHYKLMQRTEKQVEARLKKEMNRFKDKDQFELEDHIIDLENKIKELNEKIRGYQARYEGGIYNPYPMSITPEVIPSQDYLGLTILQRKTNYLEDQQPEIPNQFRLEQRHGQHMNLQEQQCLLPFRKKQLGIHTRDSTEQLIHSLMLEHQQNQHYGLEDKEYYYTVLNYITMLEDYFIKNGG